MGCCCVQKLKDVDEIDERLTESRVKMTDTHEALVFKEQGKWFFYIQGNDHFKKKAYLNAIRCYTQALVRIH